MDCFITDITKSELMQIKSLWEKLNKIHLDESIYFKDHYQTFTFENRIKSFMQLKDENIKITIITKEDDIYGYCISSIHETKSEIESLYISEAIRKKGYGKILVKQHIEWMKENKCKKIIVTVSYGHDSVLEFYHKMGFYERLIELEYKDEQ
jgi:ribosomal protein S18 acetylase RimI-like enzyme